MKAPPIIQDDNQALAMAITLVAQLMCMSRPEAEWYVRRIALLRSEGVDAAQAGQIARREAVSRPWEQWPADAPRF